MHSLLVPHGIQNVTDLFVFLYLEVSSLEPEVRSAAAIQSSDFLSEIRMVLEEEVEAEIVECIRSVLKKHIPQYEVYVGRVLAILTTIDNAFYAIHPRVVILAPAPAPSQLAKVPSWLRSLKNKRRMMGYYARFDGHILFPRGPLLRAARESDAASADSMADRFAALAVSPVSFKQEDRPISVTLKVIGPGKASGISPALKNGSEVVGFLPIAEKPDELEYHQREHVGRRFVSFNPSAALDPVAVTLNALKSCGKIDIGILPELVVPAKLIPNFSNQLLGLLEHAPRLLVCGSGETEETNAFGMRWNEATVLNSTGRVIWTQRKIWPAGFAEHRAVEYGLVPASGGLVMEDNASSNEIYVVDIDTLGRCVILICQDVLANDVSSQTISRFQPDWVFTPILDSGIAQDRWINTRLYELSGLSQSRYLVATSLSLAEKLGYPDSACGLAMGPRSSDDADASKKYTIVKAKNGIAIATWRDSSWSTSKLS